MARVAWSIVAVAGSLVAVFVCVMGYQIYEERDQIFRAHLSRAKADIGTLQTAVERFHKEQGSDPQRLQELVSGDRGRKLLGRVANNPWGGPYHYEVTHGPFRDGVKIWAVPDQRTQSELGVTELSNETDWEGVLRP
jgi:hypothetical protein